MKEENAKKATTSLKKAAGQIAHITKMIEEDKYCMDIAQQVNAAIGLLKSANEQIILSHLTTCGAKNLNNEESRDKFAKELIEIINKAK